MREPDISDRLERSKKLGFDGYCTDCESATFLYNGRCGCGSGRVITSMPSQARSEAIDRRIALVRGAVL